MHNLRATNLAPKKFSVVETNLPVRYVRITLEKSIGVYGGPSLSTQRNNIFDLISAFYHFFPYIFFEKIIF